MAMILSNFWNLLVPMTIAMEPSKCTFEQELSAGKQYYIFNPEYPKNYTPGTSCKWHAKSAPGTRIFLSCNDVTMPKSSNCKKDYLEVFSSSESHKYCGEGTFSLLSKEGVLDIVLRTTKKGSGGRFLCSVTSVVTKLEAENEFPQPQVQPSCHCGWKNERRIVGGNETYVNEYPSMAGLVDATRNVFCGATIISGSFVVTAAHCVQNKDPSSLYLLVGDHNLSTGTDTASAALYKVTAYEIWDGYDPSKYQGDIALVQVDKINFNENVGPICLPFRYSFNTFESDKVTALGWGQLEFSGPSSDTLQEVELNVLSNSDCQGAVSEDIISSELCTYSEGKDTCQNDSGGPLLWQNPASRRLFLLGIVSHGNGCAAGEPGVNTRVTSFLEWIQRRTGEYFCSA